MSQQNEESKKSSWDDYLNDDFQVPPNIKLPNELSMEQSKLEQAAIPEWIINYDKDNHQSSAGKAIRFLMTRIKEMQSLTTPASNEEVLKNVEYIKRNANKINEHTWGVYKEQILAHVEEIEAIAATPFKPHTVEAGQTQEPVDQYEVYKEEKGMLHGWYRSDPIEYEKYPDDRRRIVSTPPPAPIKTEGEDEIKQEFKELRVYIEDLYHGAGVNMQIWIELSDKMNAFERKVLAGYSASLPQSSTEEERDLWGEVIREVEHNEFLATKYKEVLDRLQSTYKISKK